MNDMIELFNRLTSTELVDCTLFEKLITKHFEKFRCFYRMMQFTSMKSITKILCKETDTSLTIYIRHIENISVKDIEYFIDELIYNYEMIETPYFTIETSYDDNVVTLDIINNNIGKEQDMYVDNNRTV